VRKSKDEIRHPGNGLRPAVARAARKTVIAAIGGVISLAGIIMLFTPGPGLVTIALGLSVLGREFPAARNLLTRVREKIRRSHDNDRKLQQ